MDNTAKAVVLPHRTRAHHQKSKGGCLTCKKRKVRCDQQKPACDRCAKAGRKCDGYASLAAAGPKGTRQTTPTTDASSPSTELKLAEKRSGPPQLFSETEQASKLKGVKLALPRNNTQEIRSYHFFLEVTAPALTGVFDAEFWLKDIPQACLADPAIWHAIVSLGAVYEAYVTRDYPVTVDSQDTFALQQYRSSIRCLTDISPRHKDKWRALVASVIFSSICIIEGLYDESRIHITSGCKLLREIEQENHVHLVSPYRPIVKATSKGYTTLSSELPVSIAPVRMIINGLGTHAKAMAEGSSLDVFDLLLGNEEFSAWRYYEAPCENSPKDIAPVSTRPSTAIHFQYATHDNIISANRAVQSLLGSVLVYYQMSMPHESSDVTPGSFGNLEPFLSRQGSFRRCLNEIKRAFGFFCAEIDIDTGQHLAGPSKGLQSHLLRPLLTIQLYIKSAQLSLDSAHRLPSGKVDARRHLAAGYKDLVDLAERILQLGSHGNSSASKELKSMPAPFPTPALYLVLHGGFPQSLRWRVIDILRRYPRIESLFDTRFGAAFGEASLRHEKLSATRAERDGGESDKMFFDNLGTRNIPIWARSGGDGDDLGIHAEQEEQGKPEKDARPIHNSIDDDEDYEEVNLLDRLQGARVSFRGKRSAVVWLRTWREFLAGMPETQASVDW